MIGLDTNLLVRYFVEDDPVQTKQAVRFINKRCTSNEPGFVDRVALCELVWVLSRGHGYRRSEIARVIEELLASQDLRLEDHEAVRAALRMYRDSGIDFADALIGQVNRARGCEATATFDRKAAKLHGFVLVS
jgi:predicted nucleic-acid-binding protein